MNKAADAQGEDRADIVLLDLEDSVMPERKAEARGLVHDLLAARDDTRRLWVRVNPLSGGETRADLIAVMPARPGGVFLPKAEGTAGHKRARHLAHRT